MKPCMIVAAILIVAGILGLIYGQFSYTKDSQSTTLGPIEFTINEKETVNVPVWVGAGCILTGAVMLGFVLMKR